MSKKIMFLVALFLFLVFSCQKEDNSGHGECGDIDNMELEDSSANQPPKISTCDSCIIAMRDPTREVFTIVEDWPCFPNCTDPSLPEGSCCDMTLMFDFITDNLVYPEAAREAGVEGTVFIGFVVTKEGCLYDIYIKRDGLGFGLGEEAVRIFQSMPDWKPGYQRTEAVDVAYTLPVEFKL